MSKTLTELQRDFINLRFGTFIHFNSATMQFNSTEMSDWEYGVENGNDARKYPFDEKDWHPGKLDTDGWARTAKSAGCRFAALTAKHHEGFALWSTAYSRHSVKNAPVSVDVVAAYLESFRKAGICAGLYFSVLDLTEGIGRKGTLTEKNKEYIKGQLGELLTGYGKIPFIIIDGWSAPWGGPSYDSLPFAELDAFVKGIQPDCLLMNIGCSDGVDNSDIVFYENSAGQDADASFAGPAISCNKLTEAWFWRTSDKNGLVNSPKSFAAKAERYFRQNINFMINISPDVNGEVEPLLEEGFRELGSLIAFPPELKELPAGWKTRKA